MKKLNLKNSKWLQRKSMNLLLQQKNKSRIFLSLNWEKLMNGTNIAWKSKHLKSSWTLENRLGWTFRYLPLKINWNENVKANWCVEINRSWNTFWISSSPECCCSRDRCVDSKKAVIDAAMAIAGVVIEMVTSLFLFLDFTYVHDICGYEVLGLDNVAR